MYDSFFGLADRPFQLTPDPRFWFDTATHKKAMAYLGYGLAQGEGFIVITGDIGAGKTTLVGHLMERIDSASLNAIRIVSTAVRAEDLLRIVAAGLDVAHEGKTKAELLLGIERGLHAVARTGRRTLLIVDEAQALPIAALEELRMLSNFQAGGHAMLQIFLLGQPEFRERLNGSERLEQLRQRVIAVHHLDPMGADEIAAYVGHRLQVAGWQGRPVLADDVFAAIHAVSDGVPRRVNQLMTRALLHAAVTQAAVVDAALLAAVVAEQRGELAAPVAPAMVVEPVEGEGASSRDAEFDLASTAPRAEPADVGAEGWTPDRVRGDEESGAGDVATIVPSPRTGSGVHRAADLHAVADAAQGMPGQARHDGEVGARALADAWMPVADAAPHDDALEARIAALETRITEQDEALRRVLTLLMDWVEKDAAPEALRGVA